MVHVARPLVRGLLLHRNAPSGGEWAHPPNGHLKEHLPSHFADGLVQRKLRTVLPAAWSASHPNDGGVWLRLGRGLPTPYRLFQSHELRLSIAVQRAKLVGGVSFPQHIALCEGSGASTVSLILESDCMLVFTGLLLLVEGPEVFTPLSFSRVVVVDVGR